MSKEITFTEPVVGIPSTMMDDYQLNLHNIISYAAKIHKNQKIISRKSDDMIFEYTYKECYERILKIANSLIHDLGILPGDRVAVLSWNTYRYFELYYAIPGIGAVLHQLNIRLSPSELVYIINHAEDKVLFVDETLIPLAEQIASQIKVKAYVIMSDEKVSTKLYPVYYYEDLVASASIIELPVVDEKSAAVMCYTTGTTGMPKGVLASHRALFLHAFDWALATHITSKDVILLIGPMFHVHSWMYPFSGPLVGAKLVLPGPNPKPEHLLKLILDHRITLTYGGPTVWQMLLNYLNTLGKKLDLSFLRGITGGSEPPMSLLKEYKEKYGVEIDHAWGMTEQNGVATLSLFKEYLNLSEEERWKIRSKQGIPISPLFEAKVVNEEFNELPWDSKSVGELVIRGPYVTKEYYKDPKKTEEAIRNGWFRTGDAVVIDEEGYIKIVDRFKDLIKSGGEWVSSVDLENTVMEYYKVSEAAAIAAYHPVWQERPVVFVVVKPEYKGKITEQEIIDFLKSTGKFAKWQLPDRIVFVEEIPKTSVGKFDKKVLREKYKNALSNK
jgi:Acyl-CoA synthetases (AMP-forming)/AMP-acid ligases II